VRPRLHNRRAMTLIEMLLLMMVLGIMAALVYPHLDSATTDADDNVHRQQLKMIRTAIELYRIQHGGQIPNLIAGWDDLTKPSAYKGHATGPYLARVPKNRKRSNVFDGIKIDPPTDYGFVYDYRGGMGTGGIWATNGSGKKLTKW
jgi:type II secretory pathway pseudopilin PulG